MVRPFKVESVHKQMYPATYNFRDDANGGNPTDWTLDEVGGTINIIASFDGHKKVTEISRVDGQISMYYTFVSEEVDETIEFWLGVNDIGAKTALFYIFEGATPLISLRLYEADIDEYDGGAWNSVKDDCIVVNTLYHIKLILDDTANTYDLYLNGVLEGNNIAYRNNSVIGMDIINFLNNTNNLIMYVDAIGFGHDTDYNIGDNVHWRHHKESTDDFEGNDVGTQGTSITWVDGVDTTASTELINEFNEHKKVLRQTFGVGTDYNNHNFATQSKTGWVEFWFKVSDVTTRHLVALREDASSIILFQIIGSKFQIYDGSLPAYRDVTNAPTPINDIWYHIFIQWYDAATDIFDLWIDNIQYEDGTQNLANQTAGINKIYIYEYTAAKYIYVDAPISSLDGDEKGDNRIFDYNAAYTSTDITTDVKNVLYKNEIYKWREAILLSEKVYENSEVFFQIYDINSKLALEAEIKNRAQISKDYSYSLRDKNQDDLEHRSSNTFVAKKIHDPTDSTSMLKVILPNVSEANGDLILVDADTKTDAYSPTTQNYPDYMMLRDISDLADSIVIITADGKCYLDDDKASGTVLDLDTAADKDNMTAPPLVTYILEDINYFEIFGAMNPDTGARFYKIIDNTGDDKKRSWRYTNNAFQNQTDVDNYAAKLDSRTTTIKIIKFTAQSLGAHNMGETINYKFVDALYNIPQANYYVIFEEINFDTNENTIILSEGMIEDSKYAAEYELPENYNDSYAGQIYETDLITVHPQVHAVSGATYTPPYTILDASGEFVAVALYIPEWCDDGRDIHIDLTAQRGDANADTIDCLYYLAMWVMGAAPTVVWNWLADTWDETGFGAVAVQRYTIPAADVAANALYYFYFKLNEGGGDRLDVWDIAVTYHIKRF